MSPTGCWFCISLNVLANPVSAMSMLRRTACTACSPASGMSRPDPLDAGAEYRSSIGIPGGTSGSFYPLVTNANVHNMKLIAGKGQEEDVFNAVYVYDSNAFPFHRAEQYHQFHCNFAPPDYPMSYLKVLYNEQVKVGLINSTGCPEGDRSYCY